ncbi:MAG: coproporphyrinogen dehydrogenase HemZ [Clostridiales Family XIII bacterium]|jgi:oxygen-independent coproporphyrinogen-3 oxidase|nr:coproporphyrinogen dehydrogenase HemZ [Clostridiales Family XIII bacterium]
MYGFVFGGAGGAADANEYIELVKMFLRPSEFRVLRAGEDTGGAYIVDVKRPAAPAASKDKNAVKRLLYERLSALTGKLPEWGILTGIRPVKLFDALAGPNGADASRACMRFREEYYVSDAKTELTARVHALQRATFANAATDENTVSVYIGIPFCPTRCQYCSFTSNQAPYARISGYLSALGREMDFVAAGMARKRFRVESIYIGGGTPTALNEEDLDGLLAHTRRCFDGDTVKEFTVEAGRPDTISAGKLRVMRRRGVDRVSINPQSMNDDTLVRIGRNHTAESVRAAFRLAREAGVPVINADLIAGLPGEDAGSFARSLTAVLELEPENITIHALAMKRAARLKEQDAEYNYETAAVAAEMTRYAAESLEKASYAPYYLYRQKQTAGNLENTGYTRDGKPGLYNVRIMDERQTVIALGAGASTKLYIPRENRLERVFNVSNYEIYEERLDEMLERKQRLLFD